MQKTNLNIIDLFCGCGGFSLGAHLAGFESVLSIDIDRNLSSSYELNFPNSKLVNRDISKTNGKQLLELAGTDKITGIVGGPPCQGFSLMGKRDEADPRNKLVTIFFNRIEYIEPSFFVMENVPGLLSTSMAKKLDKSLKRMSEEYNILGPFVINASDFGAATRRERVIVIGYKSENFYDFYEDEITAFYRDATTVREAINDLPAPISNDDMNYGWARYDGRKSVSEYGLSARSEPPVGLGWDVAVDKLRNGYVSGLMNTQHSKEIEARYKRVDQGSVDVISRAFKLDWDGVCPTLRAGTGSDKGSYQAVRPLHPESPRVITVREAARLQGFPDWFVFHPTKWHSFRMIGNSLSPYMSQAVLSLIKKNMISTKKKIVTRIKAKG